jgi:hypothetical protein
MPAARGTAPIVLLADAGMSIYEARAGAGGT